MLNRGRIPLDSGDEVRGLLTDVLPFEVPITFLNDGFYRATRHPRQLPSILQQLHSDITKLPTSPSWFTPYKYGIRTSSLTLRTLWLIHPGSQVRFARFLHSNSARICNLCENPEGISLRAPTKLGTEFIFSNPFEDLNLFRDAPEDLADDLLLRHPTTLFSYAGFLRIHKFFESDIFLDLEERFPFLLTLDVARCFLSIYTHSLPWAERGREFAKEHRPVKELLASFGDSFDKEMQISNDGETNGIPIGPEASRIFAEILFQRIDRTVVERIEKGPRYQRGRHYEILRYVDDYFIFAESKQICEELESILCEVLEENNLTLNSGKRTLYERPFLTNKSRVVQCVKKLIARRIDSSLENDPVNFARLRPRQGSGALEGLARDVIEEVRGICHDRAMGVDAAASILLGSVVHKLQGIAYGLLNPRVGFQGAPVGLCCRALCELLDIAFFCYSVAPTTNHSFKLAKGIVVAVRSVREVAGRLDEDLFDLILRRGFRLLRSAKIAQTPEGLRRGFVPLGELNVLIALRELGDGWKIDSAAIREVLLGDSVSKDASVFSITSILYYCGRSGSHHDLRSEMLDAAWSKLLGGRVDTRDTERVLLLIDLLGCPYVDLGWKRRLLINYSRHKGRGRPSNQAMDDGVADLVKAPWFTQWDSVDLLRLLERRRIGHVY